MISKKDNEDDDDDEDHDKLKIDRDVYTSHRLEKEPAVSV